MPTVSLRCAFTTAPLATSPSWTEIGSYGMGFTVERGRGSELEPFQPGQATVELDNTDRRFDPANTSSPYTGNLKARKRLSIQATYNSITYDVFNGHVKTWEQHYVPKHGRTGVPVADAFEMFNNETFSSPPALDPSVLSEYPEERSDQRLARILDLYGWPAGWRLLDTGEVIVQAAAYQGVNMLSHMQQIEETEGGFLFIDGAGNVVFQSKYKRVNSFQSSVATFGDSGVELRYQAFEPNPDVQHLVNHATGKQANVPLDAFAPAYEYSDATSITDYGRTAKTLELWSANPLEAETRAQYLVGRFSQPGYRVKSISFIPAKDPVNLWPQALGRVIGERITIKNSFYGVGSALNHLCRIEGIRHEVTPSSWKTTFRLSPVVSGIDSGDYWQLGEVGSQLGGNTVLLW